MISSRSRGSKSQSRCLLLPPLVNLPNRETTSSQREKKREGGEMLRGEQLRFQGGDYLEKEAV